MLAAGVEVGGEPVPAALAAVARLLVAAEGAGRVEPVEGVRPDDARAQLVGDGEDAAALVGPDAGRESVGVLLAFAIASAGVRNVSTDSTGPKISSRAIRWLTSARW